MKAWALRHRGFELFSARLPTHGYLHLHGSFQDTFESPDQNNLMGANTASLRESPSDELSRLQVMRGNQRHKGESERDLFRGELSNAHSSQSPVKLA
jgi:hypothetical protein